MVTMMVVAAAALLLVNAQFSHSCDEEGRVLICTSLPPYFRPGYLTLMMYLRDFGEINATVFGSSNLTSVTRLVINGAGVAAIADGAFGSLRNLSRLSLSHNVLTQISGRWFGRPAVLRELNLTGNRIEALTEATLAGLVGLTKLVLNQNRITSVAAGAFSSHGSLAEVDLSDNRLTRISPQVFVSTRVRLHRNPWDCTCDAAASVAALTDLWSRSLLDAPTEVTCDAPPPLADRPVWSVSVCATPPSGRPDPAASPAATSPRQPASGTMTSVRPKPTHVAAATTVRTTADVTSPPSLTSTSGTRSSVRPKPPDASTQTEVADPSPGTSCTLVAVIAILCVLPPLLCVLLLLLLHRRKRSSKAVIPGRPDQDGEEPEEGGGSGQRQLPGKVGTTWPCTGPRAKSANAVLSRSSGKDGVMRQKGAEAQARDAEGTHIPAREAEADPVTRPQGLTHAEERADAGGDLGENAEAVAYLSIGTNPDDASKQSTDSPGQRSQEGKLMGRISTWPLTATQWRWCKQKEEASGIFSVWTQNQKSSSEMEETVKKAEQGSGSDRAQKKAKAEKHLVLPPATIEAHTVRRSESSEADVAPEEQGNKDGVIQDVVPQKHTEAELHEASNKPTRKSSNEAEQTCGPKAAAPSRQRGGSRAPSGGTCPGDDALPSGNDMDLLHEVVQNNGRWTRERWKQIHVNRQRR